MPSDRISTPRVITGHLVRDKTVYIFQDHATAFIAWTRIHQTLPSPPYVVSLDRHTDTHTAFMWRLGMLKVGDFDRFIAAQKEMVKNINLSNETSIAESMRYLQHDEHIHAALLRGVISFAFVVSRRAGGAEISDIDERIYERRIECGTLEDSMLVPVLDDIEKVRSKLIPLVNEFVLDIDLDYFESSESVSPCNCAGFFSLVKNAKAITIAEEPGCAAPSVDWRFVKRRVLQLIEKALQ